VRSYWDIEPILPSLLVKGDTVVLVAAGLAGLLALAPTFRKISAARRTTLAVLRGLVILVLLLAMLRPTHKSVTRQRQSATLVFVLDASRSMAFPHSTGSLSRWETQQEALRGVKDLLADLAKDLEIRAYVFDSSARTIAVSGGSVDLPPEPTGDQTDLGGSLSDVVRGELGKRLVAVMILSDGAQRAYAPRADALQVARDLAQMQTPILAAPLGSAVRAEQARDVAIESLPDKLRVFAKTRFALPAQIRVQGYVNKNINVRLFVERLDSGADDAGPAAPKQIESRDIVAKQDGELIDLEMIQSFEEPGKYRLTLVAEQQEGERLDNNNRLSTFVTVLEGGLKVLYLESNLGWQEQKFIRWSLAAAREIELDFLWVDPRRGQASHNDIARVLADNEFDAFIIGDVHSELIGEENLAELVRRVAAGKGLAMLGGFYTFDAGRYSGSPLAAALPVEMSPQRSIPLGGEPQDDLYSAPEEGLVMLPTGDGLTEGPMNIAKDEETSRQAWRETLPPLAMAYEFLAVKDGAEIFAETATGKPLLVGDEYDKGRVLAFAGNSTFRWWRRGHRDLHKRFWRQVVFWITGKERLEEREVWVKLSTNRARPGQEVEVTAGASTADGEPVADAQITAVLAPPHGKSRPLTLTRQGDRWVGKIVDTAEDGEYRIDVLAKSADGATLGAAREKFSVVDEDIELQNPAADPAALEQLALATREHGGKVITPRQLRYELERIRDNPPDLEREVLEEWQLGKAESEAWLLLCLMVGLLAVEWFLRKRWKLV